MTARLIHGHASAVLRSLPEASVQCVVTSPPYWGLRSYGTEPQVWGGENEHAHVWEDCVPRRGGSGLQGATGARATRTTKHQETERLTGAFCACGAWRGELGLEPTPELYVEHMVEVFREVRRVLRDDGVLWLNIGDSYTSGGRAERDPGQSRLHRAFVGDAYPDGLRPPTPAGLKPKDLVGIPWRLAFALQADGWWLRAELIWHKPNPMPESVTDRPTKAHELVFLLAKSGDATYWTHPAGRGARSRPEPDWRWKNQQTGAVVCVEPERWRELIYIDEHGKERRLWARRNLWDAHDYFYDGEAIKEPDGGKRAGNRDGFRGRQGGASFMPMSGGAGSDGCEPGGGRNARSVWTIATQPSPVAHFATFPQELAERCILAGTSERGTCAACGAPLARVVETKGWAPTCEHGAPVVPCVVLDPFSGTGTTGKAASKLGRDYIGIDLHPGHTRTATRRLLHQVEGPLFPVTEP